MPALVLKVPKKATPETLAAFLAITASGTESVLRKIVISTSEPLTLLMDELAIKDPIAICRAIAASDSKSRLIPKKVPKLTTVDSIMESCIECMNAVRKALTEDKKSKTSASQEKYTLALKVLNQLVATIPSKFDGIGNTKDITLADVFAMATCFPVFASKKSVLPAGFPASSALAEWFKKTRETKWVRDALSLAKISDASSLDLSCVAKKSAAAGSTSSSSSGRGRIVERDSFWRPVVPVGHTTYSWPRKKKAVGNYSATAAVEDPPEWKALYATEKKTRAGAQKKVKLPIKGKKNILITSALPYVNNVPHLGNIIGCVLSADVYSRFCRMRGYNSIYICGTDEYGTTTEMKADEEQLTPQQICDKYHKIHKDVYDWFNIDFDHFGRTTTPQQTQIAQSIYQRAKKNGYILEKETKQLYDEKLQKFLADRQVEGECPKCGYAKARGDQCDNCGSVEYDSVDLKNPVSVKTGATPVVRDSKHLFLDLTKLSAPLDKFVAASQKKGIWTDNAVKETGSWIHKRGLQARCITRDLSWGTPVPEPGYQNKVFYVWFDAPIGYISITANYTAEWEQWWKRKDKDTNVKLVQFMGKDNIPFHTVIFPCTLIAANDDAKPANNFTLLDSISVCDYLQYEGGLKFSKSRGTGVFGDKAKETGIPASVWRFYLLSVRPESSDTAFDWNSLCERVNGELINKFGNLVNRCVSFLGKMGGVVPKVHMEKRDHQFFDKVNKFVEDYVAAMDAAQLREGLKKVIEISQEGNGLLQREAPWKLVKEKGGKQRADSVLGICINVVWLLAVLAEPYIPSISSKICEQLRIPKSTLFIPGKEEKERFRSALGPPAATWEEAKEKGGLFVGHKIGKNQPLFRPIDKDQLPEFRKRYGGAGSDTGTTKLFPFNVLVGEITEAKAHEKADHLAVVKVELGPGRGQKQIVSGIRKEYPDPNTLIGKRVLVVENVAPSNFKGVRTTGLLLCAEDANKTKRLIEIKADVGIKLAPKEAKIVQKRFKSKEFCNYPMEVTADGTITYKGDVLVPKKKGAEALVSLDQIYRNASIAI